MSRPNPTPFYNNSFKSPFPQSQSNPSDFFSQKKPPTEQPTSDPWAIDYSLSAPKQDNPFFIPKTSAQIALNQQQFEKNLDFFFDRNDTNQQNPILKPPEEEQRKTFLYENEMEEDDDNELVRRLNDPMGKDIISDKECEIYEEDRIPVAKEHENLNFGSKDTLNLVESDNESKNENKDTSCKTYQKSVFQVSQNNNQKEVGSGFRSPNTEIVEDIDLNQVDGMSSRKPKDEDSLYESKFALKCFPVFNFNFGWTFIEVKDDRTLLLSKEGMESSLVKVLKDFPGPIKLEKNANYITQTYNRLFAYINQMLGQTNNGKKEGLEGLSKRFAWTILNEMLLHKKLSVFELMNGNVKFRESLISFIESHFFDFYEHSINMEEFKNETQHLLNLLCLSEEQYHELIEDDQWETIFFSKLFLSTQKTQSLGKDVKDIMTHYVERSFKKWFPTHVFTLLKLGKAEKFYEDSQFLSENPMLYVWLLLKLVEHLEEESWHLLLQTVFYHLNESKKGYFIQFSLLLMNLGFDNDNLLLLLKQNNSVSMVQMFETFFFLATTISNFQYDSARFLYKNMFPAFLVHSNNLSENGFHERAIEYVNLVEGSKNFFFSLEKNWFFMNSLREIKQRLIANVETFYSIKKQKLINIVLEDSKEKFDSQQNFLQNNNYINNGSDNNDFSTNLKRNFFNYFNSALDMIKNPLNEKPPVKKSESSNNVNQSQKEVKNKDFYYDDVLKTWVINGVPAASEEDETEKKAKEKTKTVEDKSEIPPLMPTPPLMPQKSKRCPKFFFFFFFFVK